jgi:hypothetical protein
MRLELTQAKHLSTASIKGRLLALPRNDRLGWKDLPGVKLSSLFLASVNDRLKKFISSITRPNFKKLFMAVIYECS